MRTINRREFLRATPAAAVAMSCVTGAASSADAGEQGPAADVRSPRIGDARYSPNLDYPIRPIGYADVTIADRFIFYTNPNWAADGWRYLEAAPFDQSAGAKWGCFRRAIAGARGTALGTGRQNTIDILRACADGGVAAGLCDGLDVSGIRGWFLEKDFPRRVRAVRQI